MENLWIQLNFAFWDEVEDLDLQSRRCYFLTKPQHNVTCIAQHKEMNTPLNAYQHLRHCFDLLNVCWACHPACAERALTFDVVGSLWVISLTKGHLSLHAQRYTMSYASRSTKRWIHPYDIYLACHPACAERTLTFDVVENLWVISSLELACYFLTKSHLNLHAHILCAASCKKDQYKVVGIIKTNTWYCYRACVEDMCMVLSPCMRWKHGIVTLRAPNTWYCHPACAKYMVL